MAAGAMTLSPPVSDMEKAMLSTPSPPRSPSPSVDEEEEGWNGEAGTLVEQDDVEDNRTTSAVRSKTCPTCGREFKKISRLNQHILTHSDVKPFVCPVPGCGKAYKRREHLKNHATSHGTTPEERKPFVCEFEGCGASFSNAHHRNRHQKVHADGGRYKCDVEGCDEAFSKHKHLLDHRATHVAEGDLIAGHMCEEEGCGKIFPTPSKLAKHRKVHDGTLSYTCGHTDCLQAFAKWSQLQQHLKKDHAIECGLCGKTFTRRDGLKNHMKSHDDNRELFPCNWPGCTKVLTSQKILNVHIEASHQGVKRFECTTTGCTAKFAHKHLLVRHQRVHEQRNTKKIPRKKNPSSAAELVTGERVVEADQQP